MEDIKRIKIVVREKMTSDGRKFKTYKAVSKNGALIDCKFRKEVTPPTEDCYINVKVDNMNMQKNTAFKTLWVSAIESVEPIGGGVTPEQAAKNAAEINDIFG